MAVTSNTQTGENIVAFTWTVESLKEHFTMVLQQMDRRYEERFAHQERALELALRSQEKLESSSKEAIIKAETAVEKRFEGVNEFRKALSDQTSTFIPRTEAIQRTEQNAEKIAVVDKRVTEGFAQINSRLDLGAGKSVGMNAIWGYIVGAVGLTATIISVVLILNN